MLHTDTINLSFDDIERRVSLNIFSNENYIHLIAQEQGNLTVSLQYNKNNNTIETIEGSLAQAVNQIQTLSTKEKVLRLIEYAEVQISIHRNHDIVPELIPTIGFLKSK